MEKTLFKREEDRETMALELPGPQGFAEEPADEKPAKRASRPLYALLTLLLLALGTAIGLLSAVCIGVAGMQDVSHFSAEELEEAAQWGWVAEFPGVHTQSDFCSTGLTIIILLSIVFLAVLIGLCVMTGRFRLREDGRPALNWFDRIFSEVHILLLICASTGAVALMAPVVHLMQYDNRFGFIDLAGVCTPVNTDEYVFNMANDLVFWYCLVGMLLCIWAAAVFLITLVKKIKAGELIHGSLLGKILEFLGWSAKQTGQGARKAAGSIRRLTVPAEFDRGAARMITLKYVLIALALLLLPEVLGMLFGDPFLALVLEAAVILIGVVLIVRKIRKLTEISAGVATVKSGNLSYKIPVVEDEDGPKTDLDKLASDINHISEATNAAVQNEIKNQRLKTDLISNVSHDLKTPLTSMISYLDILEKEGLDSEDAPAHLAIVREKTERLRVLTEELFEAAKASSGNIPCEIETIDLSALIDQSLAEMGDRLAAKELDIRKNIRVESALVLADGKLLYRVLENLLSNISKYALENSRVYIDVSKPAVQGPPAFAEGRVLLEVKNISRDELNISPEELMERFTRGDQSRNTEGSGLGLAIAKDLTNLMGGTFDITIDGDMFKVSVLLRESAK